MQGEIRVKTREEIKIMQEGGKKLAKIKKQLRKAVKVGRSALDIEKLANDLIKKSGAEPSFKMVPNYHWATCINVNSGLVHGIPKKEIIFKEGDIVSIDVGIFYRGFHTDTSTSVGINVSKDGKNFLKAGEEALEKAINKTVCGNRIFDISSAIESTLNSYDFNPIKVLVGHGIGRDLHEPPQIPCFIVDSKQKTEEILPGMVFAIEVMYAEGSPEVVLEKDGWTISMADAKISGLFEETVAATSHGPIVLTEDRNDE